MTDLDAEYRDLLLHGRLPAPHTRARRQLVMRLRFDAHLPVWAHTPDRPAADLGTLIVQVRKAGPAWSW